MFGSHLSIAGDMCNALRDAEALGLDTVQVFTKNQQQWKAKPLPDSQIRDWHAEIKRLNWTGPARGTSHASYLINLASPDDVLWKKSIDLMRDEIERCELLSIPYLVHHPGAYTTSTLEEGIKRIAAAYAIIFKDTKGYSTISCLEGTAGAGTNIGGDFAHLALLRKLICEATGQPARIGFCLDTCHMHVAGYDMSSRAAAEATLAQFDSLCGLKNLHVMHINDSKGKLGSHLDRHDHIGAGELTPKSLKDSGFAGVLNHPAIRSVPKIMETPKGDDPKGTPFDTLNLRRLKGLIDKPAANPTRGR